MKHATNAFFVALIATVSCSVVQEFHTRPDKWKESRNYHTPFIDSYSSRIRIDQAPLLSRADERTASPNQGYWYSVSGPDLTNPGRGGSWNTTILIHNETDNLMRIRLLDHIWQVRVSWVNEKLISIRVWWGRILGTDLIVDVEQERIIFKEMVNNGWLAFLQWQPGNHPPIPQ